MDPMPTTSLATPEPEKGKPDPYAARTFAQTLMAQENGDLHQHLTEKQSEMIRELKDYAATFGGKPKGKITLELNYRLDGEIMELTAATSSKMPPKPRQKTVFWTHEDDTLTRSNPKQQELPFRAVADNTQSIPKSV